MSPIQIGGGYGRPPHISKDVAMGVAPGGFIKQCVLEDTNLATIWERDHTICFNVQILNSAMFQQVTGTAPPSTPISAKAYADQGLPFYKIYGETSTVKGDFDGIKSVKQLDNIKNENGKRKNEGNSALKTNKKQKDISDGEKDDSDEAEDNSDSEEEEDGGSDNEEDYSDEHDQLDTDQDEAPVDDDGDKQTFQNPVIVLNPDGSAMGKFTPVSELMEELSRMKLRNSKLRPAKG